MTVEQVLTGGQIKEVGVRINVDKVRSICGDIHIGIFQVVVVSILPIGLREEIDADRILFQTQESEVTISIVSVLHIIIAIGF